MNAPAHAALHQALAVTGTAFGVAVLQVGQPFLAVLAAQITAVIPCCGGRWDFVQRLGSAWAGSMTGALVLTAFPQQPWLSLPVFAALSGSMTLFVMRRFGPASGILFAMGICGTFSAGIIYPNEGLFAGAAHALSLTTAVVTTFLVSPLAGPPAPTASASPPDPWLMGACCAGSLILALVTLPSQTVVMTIAALTCVLALSPGLRGIMEKVLGGIAGAVAALIFIVAVSAMTNDLAAFLLAMGIAVGGFEALAWRGPVHATVCRQAAAMFVVTATLLPRPEESLQGSGERMTAILLGLAVAGCLGLGESAIRSKLAGGGSRIREPAEPRREGS